MNKMKARIVNEYKDRVFYIENYSPVEGATIDGVIKNIKDFENEDNVITNVEELNVCWDDHTDDYTFYELQTFNACKYSSDLDDNMLEDIKEYIDYIYICIPK